MLLLSLAVDLKNGSGSIYQGEPRTGTKAGCTLTISDENFIALASGKLNGQQVYYYRYFVTDVLFSCRLFSKANSRSVVTLC